MSQLLPTEHNAEFIQDQTLNLRSPPSAAEGILSPNPPPSNTPPQGADPEEQNETQDDEEGKNSKNVPVKGKKRRHYCKISDAAREKLVQLVVSKGLTVHEAAHECNINISTAKGIVDIYMKEGRIGKKKKRDRPTNIITNYIIANVNPMQMGAPTSVTPLATVYSTRYPPGYPGKQKEAMGPPQPPQIQPQMPSFPGFQNPPPYPMNTMNMNPTRYPPINPQMNTQMAPQMNQQMNPQSMHNMGMNRFQPGQMLPPPPMHLTNGFGGPPSNFMMNFNNNNYNPYHQGPAPAPQMNMNNMFPPNMNMYRQPITSSTQLPVQQQQPLLSPVKEENQE